MTAPTAAPALLDLAGSDRVARQLLSRLVKIGPVELDTWDWRFVLACSVEGATAVVDHTEALRRYLADGEAGFDPTAVAGGILEVLWRLRHQDPPCLGHLTRARSLDDMAAAGPANVLCDQCKQAEL